MSVEPNTTPKPLTTITIKDNRGTSISLTLFLSPLQHTDFCRELSKVWADQFGGTSTETLINGKRVELPVMGIDDGHSPK